MGTFARKIFHLALLSVQPDKLIASNIQRNNNILYFDGQNHVLKNNVYVVGFGKAVSGMCHAIQTILDDHIVTGILSVPFGLEKKISPLNKKNLLPIPNGKITVYECAENNFPDQQSAFAASKIIELCENLVEDDLIIALVSGGGSALLPAPLHPLTLETKSTCIQKLSNKGATIQEINTVRIQLSSVKGGQLAEIAKPAKMWGFILSDVIGDPIELIASGPTVPTNQNPEEAIKIIEKYGLKSDLATACKLLQDKRKINTHQEVSNVVNKIIGNNTVAINTASVAAAELGYKSFILSKCLQGEAKYLGNAFADLIQILLNPTQENIADKLAELFKNHGIYKEDVIQISSLIASLNHSTKLCIIAGGETTVTLPSEHGLGGRNQELVLAFALRLKEIELTLFQNSKNLTVTFLSGGTDGQDGPTSAAGAVFDSRDLVNINLELAKDCLEQHNSYNYFLKSGGLINTGFTGTNVMDIQLLLIEQS